MVEKELNFHFNVIAELIKDVRYSIAYRNLFQFPLVDCFEFMPEHKSIFKQFERLKRGSYIFRKKPIIGYFEDDCHVHL